MEKWEERFMCIHAQTQERLAEEMRIRIRGEYWKLLWERPPHNNCDGVCVNEIRTIYIRPTCPEPIPTVIHEVLHACLPDVTEEVVCEVEDALVDALDLI